ncbi:DNA alkylation repair protein [Mucilaginibacter sp. BJC16-A38]|uniref:DNA alkylation repair protein n=1 Tax=Mucilaginibacter phenanthrenivorans TaxID=1234842 RepID=UPI0021578C9A|nr:DNA alkylation repair protein [Mucilaginibacter phenanthrenivorans]MCR8560025.1 DNA alkylation repair protein [Mucilaginibacter phenanthrenivorans]
MDELNTPGYSTELREICAHIYSLQGNVPLHRRESRRVYSFSSWTFTEQLAIWDELWRTADNFWLKLHAFFFLERHLKKDSEMREMWLVIVHWQDQVDDWGLCDALAKIYTKIMELETTIVYEQLKKWSSDKNLWKRRQSVVSLLYYSRTKKFFSTFNQIEQLITRLLNDKEYYVQKGVGWSLRELHNVYPVETLSWLRTNIKSLSSIAFTIAIEKTDEITRSELKALRKLS